MGRTCAFVNCTNSTYKLERWKKSMCKIHKTFHMHAKCSCEAPFKLIIFPQTQNERNEWTKLISRKDPITGKNWTPNSNSRVCSQHFIDGTPTSKNPIPTLNLPTHVTKQQSRKRPAVQSSPNATTPLKKIKAENDITDNAIQTSLHFNGGYCKLHECEGCNEKMTLMKEVIDKFVDVQDDILIKEAPVAYAREKADNILKVLKSDQKMSTPTTSPTKDRPKDRPNFAVPKPTCPNCNDEFDKTESRPKILPCGHSICLSCLLRMTQPKLYKGLSRCPICHEVVDLPPGGYADLKDNIVVTDLLRTIKPAKCVSHAPEAYISLCMTCHRPLCTTCQREAMVGNVHRGHEIVTYDKGMMSLRNNLHHEIEGTEQLYREKIVDPNTSLQATYKADSEKKSAIIDQLVTDAIEQIKHWGDGMKSRLAEKSEQDLKTLELSKSDFEAKIASLSSESFACIESQDKILNKEQYSKIKSDHKILSKEMEKSKLPKLHTLNITSEKGIAVKFPKFEDCKFNAQ